MTARSSSRERRAACLVAIKRSRCCGACRDAQVSGPALDAVQHVLADGSWPEVALEAVQLVADLIRKRKCSCSPQVPARAGSPASAHVWLGC